MNKTMTLESSKNSTGRKGFAIRLLKKKIKKIFLKGENYFKTLKNYFRKR